MADGGVWVKVHPDDAGGGAPGAAVIGGATGAVTESSFTENGQAYDVYEFLGSGELNVTSPGVLDSLVVGGGAGGGGAGGGGGGAGGVAFVTDIPLGEAGNYPVTVGAGGAKLGNSQDSNAGINGDKSSFYVLLSVGGGGGAAKGRPATNGASGGGGSENAAGGTGIVGIGHDGGAGNTSGGAAGGGGGGGETRGSSVTVDNRGGAGGQGRSVPIKENAGLYGVGGGGGAQGGTGGAGAPDGSGKGASGSTAPTSGSANTGNGGGGGGANGGAKAGGGSGVVCIRVKVSSPSYPFSTKTTAPRTAHAARIEDGIVRQVIVIPHLDDDDAKITAYCNSIGLPGTWVDTSYTGSRRGKYAGVGDEFHHEARSGEGEFVSPITEEPVVEEITE